MMKENKVIKGIILAGGLGTRLYPTTKILSKQLLQIYDKPMIFYPISTLLLAGVRDILIITKPEDKDLFYDLLGDGSKLGVHFEYACQDNPVGIPDAFIIGENFIDNNHVCLILGDNFFHSDKFINKYLIPIFQQDFPTIFGCHVHDPKRYGIIEFKGKKVLSIEEKPFAPKSSYAVTGIYYFDGNASVLAKNCTPSDRGETEIVDMLNEYLSQDRLNVEIFGRGVTWMDMGTNDSLLEASNYVSLIEKKQGFKIACLEEIAFQNNYISKDQLIGLLKDMIACDYKNYLLSILRNYE